MGGSGAGRDATCRLLRVGVGGGSVGGGGGGSGGGGSGGECSHCFSHVNSGGCDMVVA